MDNITFREAPMTTVLQINSSLFSDKGASTALADRLVARLRATRPDTAVVRRDLARDPLPHFDGATMAALTTPAAGRTPEQAATVARADALIDEVKRADVLVIAAPMYNFHAPTQLKAWFDYIARAGVTFRYTATGPEGLLTGKRAYVVTTRGGVHRDAPTDNLVPYLKTMLGFVGITDVDVIYAEGLAMGDEPRRAGLAQAEAAIDVAIGSGAAVAA
jgi:FMN-dependent NADH-azoreductase